MPLIFSVVVVAGMVYALVDLIMRDESQVKHLPKFGWILLVVLLPLIGTILWFVLGREYAPRGAGLGGFTPAGRSPEPYVAPPAVPRDTRSTEEQLADLDREIEFYEQRAELERRRRELDGGAAPGG
ncbi:PLDc N-terminal domain-containing protein [Agromyces sp. H3Y2-19a]|uniref:PLDc N-terminal domain-containing protein n=1 Tax=Agromyces TaxID=33877 RepID=UPI0023BA01C3|nr:PLDc N-terminal domain-containing protein [Agromyces chromiiresistens]MDF0514331.1 PLDc N-terminal domain-containing protein [Agromyces chromiiresistens]